MERNNMLGNFRYKNYEFYYHPASFTISHRRNIREFPMPDGKSAVQEMGREAAVITGEGVLLGEDSLEQYAKLQEVFLSPGSGSLFLPGMSPVFCFFKELSVSGKPGPKMLTYRFMFLEDTRKNSGKVFPGKSYYRVEKGDTLTVIAAKCGVSENELLRKNPSLNLSGEIREGSIIWIS